MTPKPIRIPLAFVIAPACLLLIGLLAWLSWAMAIEFPRLPDRQHGGYAVMDDTLPVGCRADALERLSSPEQRVQQEELCSIEARRRQIEHETLVQAYRSTDAAEEAVRLTFQQTRIGFFQAFFSVFALLITAWAAWAASRASRAAERAVAHADEVMRNDLRAYVHVEKAELTWGSDGARPVITLFAKNTGQTPARWFGASAKVMATADDDVQSFNLEAIDLSDRPLIRWSALAGHGGELSFYGMKNDDYPALRDAYDNQKILNVVGHVQYETLFGEVFETEFWFTRRPEHRPNFQRPEGAPGGMAVYGVATEKAQALQRAPVALSCYRLVTPPNA